MDETADVPFTVTVSANGISAPDTVTAGWTRIRVIEQTGSHIVVFFRIPSDLTPRQQAQLVTALDTAQVTPGPAIAVGGPEIGEDGEVTVRLDAGRYLIGCVRRGEDGHRHITSELDSLIVLAAGTQEHLVRIARLHDSVSIKDVMYAEDPATMMDGVAGVARMSPGQRAFLPLDLERGTYLLTCLITDPARRLQHVELGMFRQVVVR